MSTNDGRTQRLRPVAPAGRNLRLAKKRALVLSLVLIAYHGFVTLPDIPGTLLTLLNITLALALIIVTMRTLGMTAADLGLRQKHARPFCAGIGLAAFLVVPLALVLVFHIPISMLRDARYGNLTQSKLAVVLLLQIPFQTVLVEEIAFRGVLFAILRPLGRRTLFLWTSVVFGLWHIGPAISLARAHTNRLTPLAAIVAVLATVAATTLGGLVLAWLRVRLRSLAAPIGFHLTLNILTVLLSYAAWHR